VQAEQQLSKTRTRECPLEFAGDQGQHMYLGGEIQQLNVQILPTLG
jgi:hypothetical protein